MIIIKLLGGMGNQMFQISLYKALEERGKDVYLDTTKIHQYLKGYNRASVFDVFNIKVRNATIEQIEKLSDEKKDLFSKIRRKMFVRKKTHYLEKEEGAFSSEIFELDDVYLDGYWQTYKYFLDYRNQVLEMFCFPDITDDVNKNYLKMINNSKCAVSLHIRLGDYLELARIYGGICTEDYYKSAILYFKNKYKNPTFYVFSNDPKTAKNICNDESFIFIEANDESKGWIDMFLMTQCNHNIIANSSFSWWGAWLNQHENKEVIAPKKWINNEEMRDICPKEWIRL